MGRPPVIAKTSVNPEKNPQPSVRRPGPDGPSIWAHWPIAARSGTLCAMADVRVYHNPNCSTSKGALAMAADAGVDVEVVQYLKTKPDATELAAIVAKLDGPVT